ncbi:MAG TPA: hypothetical protein PL059_14110 [Spirochaetota bacterium]|nr:hypothetical protein [Spirochaetota bacterium]HOM10246.1 hypothetical protein [Spirochaetota bacterium]HPP49161.1 hypothetical protein [Spirochaetota bacterium]
MSNAITIIQKHELIANLTHLLNMDNGGRKYYLLEYEHISEMISNVTEQFYDDLIIINSSYTILYSMKNIDLYGRRLSQLSPVLYYFVSNLPYDDIAIFKPFEYPPMSGNYSFCVCYPIQLDDRNKGFCIGMINQNKFYDILPADSIIAETNGEVIFNIIQRGTLKLDENTLKKSSINVSGKKYNISLLKYKNITWYILYP